MSGFLRKIIILSSGILFLTGCATYKFHHGKAPYDKGYMVSRDDYTIPEYTIGKDNQVPPLKLAKERFNRRRKIVEDYYKRMGYIENHFKMAVYDPSVSFLKLIGGIFRLPFIAISDYRYEHNPKYKEKIKKMEAEQDNREANRIKSLTEKLNEYMVKDLAKETPVTEEAAAIQAQPEQLIAAKQKEALTQKTAEVDTMSEEKSLPAEELKLEPPPSIIEQQGLPETQLQPQETITTTGEEESPSIMTEEVEKPVEKERPAPPGDIKAVITARPLKGFSPLRVQFNGRQSASTHGKIVSYYWGFGDQDTSTKPNPVNTYWSATLGSRYFTATLTVKDDKGNTATSSVEIEVTTK